MKYLLRLVVSFLILIVFTISIPYIIDVFKQNNQREGGI